MKKLALLLLPLFSLSHREAPDSWIRINLLGYQPAGTKVAIWGSKQNTKIDKFQLVDANLQKVVFEASAGKAFGAYGPFEQSYRLNFSAFKNVGKYFLRVGETRSPEFEIDDNVYAGVATFCLKYMRQQRSGFNPFLKDSCHTHDGYTMYGPMPDSTHINVYGGWHDATDYLQYVTTSANATFHLLAAYRDFPAAFGDQYQSNGLEGSNGRSDILDEARWGLDWLLKMHPRADWMFNQLADDRDHVGFRLPNKDSANYGKGLERPVYFCTGEPQGLGKYKNKATGTASTAGKFSSAFALGYQMFQKLEPSYASHLRERAFSAYTFGLKKPGVCQTASVVAPYIYAEDNWTDDMELAAAKLYSLTGDTSYRNAGLKYASQETVTPWMGADTANHYQWYPFVNVGHFELAKQLSGKEKLETVGYYRQGIEKVWDKARTNAFYRGVPFIWCSNNLTTSFAIQCYWYRELTGDQSYLELEEANFDWLLGCNPWGTSMIVGYPANGDYPDDPHSSLHVLNGYQTLGGLVDGPVYGKIFRKQLGVSIVHGDEYSNFQSDYVVYHDDYGDYVTNEPTMDGTASLIYLLAAKESESRQKLKKKL
jgi:endoglucanase